MEARQLSSENRFRCLAGGVSLVVAFLLCFGVFLLPFLATGSEVPSGLDVANLPRVDQATNGTGYLLYGTYLVGPVEEVEDAEKYPLNAELLTMLLLAVSFGATLGWLLSNAQRQEASCSLAVVRRWPPACEDLPFLAVFRLLGSPRFASRSRGAIPLRNTVKRRVRVPSTYESTRELRELLIKRTFLGDSAPNERVEQRR